MDEKTDIDPAALARLKELGGSAFAAEMIGLFLGMVPNMVAEARAGLAGGNLEPAMRTGHSLKSSAEHVGAIAVREVAARLERAARSHESDRIPALITELENTVGNARIGLEEARRVLAG